MEPVSFKRGSTFPATCQYLENGAPAVLPVGIRSQVRRNPDELIAELAITIVDSATGKFTATCDDTSTWPLGKLRMDIEYTYASGAKCITPTLYFDVMEPSTHD